MEVNWMYEVSFFGYLMGGKIVMQFVMYYFEMVEKMVVVDIGLKFYVGGYEIIIQVFNDLLLEKIDDCKEVDVFLVEWIFDFGVC